MLIRRFEDSCQRLTVHTDRLGIETNYIMFSRRSIFTREWKIPYYSPDFSKLEKKSLLAVLCNKAAAMSVHTSDEAI